ncbi:Hypp809 [Branchiostoma lanceolatum]|uniref:Hypp809 protein n=1 Tax=Branchiostoma lanceolatum TaxID=7740 RepID=A0A8J9VNU5_BRALA|nr:Hypp809 [Branchiostoma lanceolatum]
MAGLVADYDSDDSSDSENIDEELLEEANREDQKGTNYLEGASSSSSDSEDNVALPDDSKSTPEWRQKLPSPNLLNLQSRNPGRRTLSQTSKLPNPLLGGQARPTHGRTSAGQSASIFHNPYKIAEREKEKVLEKHVKLTPNEREKPSHIAGKKVCWNFRKGRCRFGHKCKYAHDSDLPISPQPTDAPTGAVASSAGYFDQPEVLNDEEDPDNPLQQRKKRPGLSQTLQPPKKSIKAYQKQLAVERPWMAQK